MKPILHNLFKVPLAASFAGLRDCHCHILPGVDDGFRTLESSLSVLGEYERSGVASVCLTPHIMEDMPNATADLREIFESLKKEYRGHMQLHLASENMMDFLFGQRLEAGDLLTLPGRRLLVETSYYNPPQDFHAVLERIKRAGYIPLLAHPERYAYMDEREYISLKGMGVQFQLNLPSIAGACGHDVKARAERLLEGGMYDCSGTDLHDMEEFALLRNVHIQRAVAEKISF